MGRGPFSCEALLHEASWQVEGWVEMIMLISEAFGDGTYSRIERREVCLAG